MPVREGASTRSLIILVCANVGPHRIEHVRSRNSAPRNIVNLVCNLSWNGTARERARQAFNVGRHQPQNLLHGLEWGTCMNRREQAAPNMRLWCACKLKLGFASMVYPRHAVMEPKKFGNSIIVGMTRGCYRSTQTDTLLYQGQTQMAGLVVCCTGNTRLHIRTKVDNTYHKTPPKDSRHSRKRHEQREALIGSQVRLQPCHFALHVHSGDARCERVGCSSWNTFINHDRGERINGVEAPSTSPLQTLTAQLARTRIASFESRPALAARRCTLRVWPGVEMSFLKLCHSLAWAHVILTCSLVAAFHLLLNLSNPTHWRNPIRLPEWFGKTATIPLATDRQSTSVGSHGASASLWASASCGGRPSSTSRARCATRSTGSAWPLPGPSWSGTAGPLTSHTRSSIVPQKRRHSRLTRQSPSS